MLHREDMGDMGRRDAAPSLRRQRRTRCRHRLGRVSLRAVWTQRPHNGAGAGTLRALGETWGHHSPSLFQLWAGTKTADAEPEPDQGQWSPTPGYHPRQG